MLRYAMLWHTIRYHTIPYHTMHYNTIPYHTILCCTIQREHQSWWHRYTKHLVKNILNVRRKYEGVDHTCSVQEKVINHLKHSAKTCAACFNISNSAFCSQSVFVGFVWFS
jgi:hypothetical protein